MAQFPENMNLDFLFEDEDLLKKFYLYAAQEGKALPAYSGDYIIHTMGDLDVIVRLTDNEDEPGHHTIIGADLHSAGYCTWELICSEININRSNADRLERRIIAKDTKGHGMLVINVVNADVLPSYLQGDKISLQMVAFPLSIAYYADEEEYARTELRDLHGRKYFVAEGSILPLQMLANRDPENSSLDEYADDIMLMCAKIKHFRKCNLLVGEKEVSPYVCCTVETVFGDLELVHTFEQVPEEMRENMKAGAIVVANVVLSGDAAVNEYVNGMILDEAHDLDVLRQAFVRGEAWRMAKVLTEDAEYISETTGKTYRRKKEIIDRFLFVHEGGKRHYAMLATLKDGAADDLPYRCGQRCIVLAEETPDNLVSIVFADVNEEGLITRLTVTDDSRYRFEIDRKEVPDEDDVGELHTPASAAEAISLRAASQGIVAWDMPQETLMAAVEDDSFYREKTDWAMNLLLEKNAPSLEQLVAYLYVKAIENAQATKMAAPMTAYSAEEAAHGIVRSNLPERMQKILEREFSFGTQYYKEIQQHIPTDDSGVPEGDELLDALVLIQKAGHLCAEVCMKDRTSEEPDTENEGEGV